MREVLFIAYYFPPIGGGGVQRSLKFVKYLPEYGIRPIVLTGPGKATGRWTPDDISMVEEIPSKVPVYRVHDWDVKGRRTSVLAAGEAVAAKHNLDCILVTMSPYEDAGVAAELSKRLGIPWIADLRDPWALDEFMVYRTRWHRLSDRRRMARSLESASSIIMNTPQAAGRLRTAFPHFAERTISITNGYDESDFIGAAEALSSSHFNIVHSGYFHAQIGLQQRRRSIEYCVLGRAEHGVNLLSRSHYFLIQALERWQQTNPEILRKVRVICMGLPTDIDKRLVQQSPTATLFKFTGYLPHRECLRHVRGADLLFLPLHKMPPGHSASIVPGKAYEYLASGRPILAAVPEGDAKDFIRKAATGFLCEPDDVAGMATILESRYNAWRSQQFLPSPNPNEIVKFERRKLAISLAAEIERVSSLSPGRE